MRAVTSCCLFFIDIKFGVYVEILSILVTKAFVNSIVQNHELCTV